MNSKNGSYYSLATHKYIFAVLMQKTKQELFVGLKQKISMDELLIGQEQRLKD